MTIAEHYAAILAIHSEVRAIPSTVLYANPKYQDKINKHQKEIERLRKEEKAK